jgi:hypothetical protein
VQDVCRCLTEPFELSREFRFNRFLLGDATSTTLIRLSGKRALTCELNYLSGKDTLDKTRSTMRFHGVSFSARWMAYDLQGSDPRDSDPPKRGYGRRARYGG